MLATFDEVDLERELCSRLTGNQRLRLRTARLPRPPWSWLASWLTIGGRKRVMDLVGGATIERRMWSILVIPVDEQLELILKSCLAHRDQPATCSLTLHRADEPLEDRDATVLPNGAKPWLDCPSAAPGLVCWSNDFDVHGRTVNSARNRKFETDRLIVDQIR